MDVLRAMSVLIEQPSLALVPAVALLVGAIATRSRGAAMCGVLWAAYCGYEDLMKYRVLCAGECNIRVDLLAIYPLLLSAGVVGSCLVLRAWFRRCSPKLP